MTIDTMTALLRELSPAAQNRIFKLILAEAQDDCAEGQEADLLLETIGIAPGSFIAAIKAVRIITGISLREAKALCDAVVLGAPSKLKRFDTAASAKAAGDEILSAGATYLIRAAS